MLLLRAETYVQYLQYHNTTIIHININPCYIRRNEACMIIYMYLPFVLLWTRTNISYVTSFYIQYYYETRNNTVIIKNKLWIIKSEPSSSKGEPIWQTTFFDNLVKAWNQQARIKRWRVRYSRNDNLFIRHFKPFSCMCYISNF